MMASGVRGWWLALPVKLRSASKAPAPADHEAVDGIDQRLDLAQDGLLDRVQVVQAAFADRVAQLVKRAQRHGDRDQTMMAAPRIT